MAHIAKRRLRGFMALSSTGLVFACLWLVGSQAASAAPPAICGGTAHVNDATGDGHHLNTDVTSAWFSEDETGLRAVTKVNFGDWQPAHEDSNGAGWAFLFKAGSTTRYVRFHAPFPWDGPSVYDYGTWTSASGFASQGLTTGSVVSGPGGTVTIDVPVGLGLSRGDVLTQTQVLTYDGIESGHPHWVDRAPGGTAPSSSSFGADFVVGTCLPRDPDLPGGDLTTAVQLQSGLSRKGAGTVSVSGSVLPARAGVPVELSVATLRGGTSQQIALTTAADGTFSAAPRISETSLIRVVAGDSGIASRTLTVTVNSKIVLKLGKNLKRKGKRRITVGRAFGQVDPVLPGRVLILPVDGFSPVARTRAKANGSYSIRSKKIRRGRYEAVFIPDKARAERATSKKARLR